MRVEYKKKKKKKKKMSKKNPSNEQQLVFSTVSCSRVNLGLHSERVE